MKVRGIYGLDSEMNFGKYKGWKVSDVLKDKGGINYISWCYASIPEFALSNEAFGEWELLFGLRDIPKSSLELQKYYQDLIATQNDRLSRFRCVEENHDRGNRKTSYSDEFISPYAGSYASGIAGYSDEVIDEAFDGDPEVYWNID